MPRTQNQWFLRCKVGAGMFGSERSVSFQINGHEETAIVDAEDVIVAEPVQPSRVVDGLVRVHLIERGRGQALVDLPSDTFASGMRLIVPESLLESRGRRA